MTNCRKSIPQRILGLTLAFILALSVFSVVPGVPGLASFAESTDTATQVKYKGTDSYDPYQEWYFETVGEAYSGISVTSDKADSYAKWRVEEVGNYYRFVNQGNNKVLAQNGTTLNLVTSSDTDDYQLWEVRKLEDFTAFGTSMTVYNFLNKATGEVLRIDTTPNGRCLYMTDTQDPVFWQMQEVMTSFADTEGDTVDLATGTDLLIRIGHPLHYTYFTAITNYKIRNKVSEKLLTVTNNTLETYETERTDASQLWQLRPSAVANPAGYLNLYNVESGNFIGTDGSSILWDKQATDGDALMSLNDDISITAPEEGVAYRIKPIDWKGNIALSEYNPDYNSANALDNPVALSFEERLTGFDAQLWKFIRVSDNVPGMYYIQNKASGNYLTIDPNDGKKAKTCAFEPLDYRQIWMVEDPATANTSVNDNYICIYNFGSWNFIYAWEEYGVQLPWCDGYCGAYNGSTGTDRGETCFQLNGIKQTPVSGEYYRITTNGGAFASGITRSLTEAGHTYTPVDSSVNYIESASSRNHISTNWILESADYQGETVYTIKNKDLGLVINQGFGLSYAEPGDYSQYFRFVETSANTYEIQNVFTNVIMVWAGGTGATPGTTLSGAGLGSGYTWQLIGETGSVSVCEGTFMLRGQGGTMRAVGGTPYTLDVQDKATASYEAKKTGHSAQLWSFEEDETVTGAYRIINKASGKYLTLEEADLFTTATLADDNRQLWKLEASGNPEYSDTYINLINVASGTVICANQDGLITEDANNQRGESLMLLSGKFDITPTEGKYYRIDLIEWYVSADGEKLSLGEEGHTYTPVDSSVNYIESASSRNHISTNWILEAVNYQGETVYTIKNKDLGFVINSEYQLTYEEPGDYSQYWRFIETSANTYEIQNVFTNAILVWAGGTGATPGTSLSGAGAGSGYTWQLIGETGSVSVCEGTFMLRGQGGTMRAVGGTPYTLDAQDKATASYEARELGQSAQLWSFEEDETVTGAYRIINKASGKYLTLEETDFFTTETLSNDGRQLWKLEASPISGYESTNINLINVASGTVICADNSGLRFDLNNQQGQSLMSLSGKFNITPTDGEYYRIDLVNFYQIDGKELSLTEAGHEALEPIDSDTFYVGSASLMPHTSINWTLTQHNFNGETVYTIQSEDTGLFLTWGNAKSGQMGLDYEYGNDTRQFFKFEDLGYNSYYIRAVGNGDPYLIWDGVNARPYGKGISFGDPETMDCSWQLNSGTAAVGEGTFTLSCQGGALRAVGGSEYNPETPVDVKTIYVSNDGDDANDGLTEDTPIKSIDRLNQMNILAGTEVLFRKGDTFVGQVMINSVLGTTDNPVVFGNYGTSSANPKIQAPEIENGVLSASVKAAKKRPNDSTIYSAIRITYSENIEISGIDLYSTNDGETYYSHISNPNALLYADNSIGIKLQNMNFEAEVEARHKEYNCDVTGDYDLHMDLSISYPYQGNDYYGFLITHSYNPENTDKSNIVINNVSVSHVTANAINAGQFTMSNVECVDSPAWGFTFTDAYDGIVTDCKTNNTGYGYNYNGSAAFMTTSSHDILFNNLLVENAHRNEAQNWDGVGFDFEGGKNQNNIVLQNSIFKNIDGSAIMIFDNTDGNKQIKIINVYVKNANIAETDEGAINLYPNGKTPDKYTNTVDFTGVTVIQNGSLPFYTGYSDSREALLEYKGVTFTDCVFASSIYDINGDGEENADDVIVIIERLLTANADISGINEYIFDVNTDNVINLLDLVRLKRNLAKIA